MGVMVTQQKYLMPLNCVLKNGVKSINLVFYTYYPNSFKSLQTLSATCLTSQRESHSPNCLQASALVGSENANDEAIASLCCTGKTPFMLEGPVSMQPPPPLIYFL